MWELAARFTAEMGSAVRGARPGVGESGAPRGARLEAERDLDSAKKDLRGAEEARIFAAHERRAAHTTRAWGAGSSWSGSAPIRMILVQLASTAGFSSHRSLFLAIYRTCSPSLMTAYLCCSSQSCKNSSSPVDYPHLLPIPLSLVHVCLALLSLSLLACMHSSLSVSPCPSLEYHTQRMWTVQQRVAQQHGIDPSS